MLTNLHLPKFLQNLNTFDRYKHLNRGILARTFPTLFHNFSPIIAPERSNQSNEQERSISHSVQINQIQTFHGAKGSKDRRNPVVQTTASTPRTASTSLSTPSVTSALTFSHSKSQRPKFTTPPHQFNEGDNKKHVSLNSRAEGWGPGAGCHGHCTRPSCRRRRRIPWPAASPQCACQRPVEPATKTVVVFFSSASSELADASFMVEAALQRKKSFLAAAGTAEGRCGRAVTPQTALAMSFWVAWAWQWPTEP